jgi:hypothetical protein
MMPAMTWQDLCLLHYLALFHQLHKLYGIACCDDFEFGMKWPLTVLSYYTGIWLEKLMRTSKILI